MPIALSPAETFDYVLKAERDLEPERRTTFKLRSLTLAEERELARLAAKDEFAAACKILQAGLRGWEQFQDRKGEPVPFDVDAQGRPTEDALARLSVRDRVELGRAIMGAGELSEEDLGE